MTEKKCFKCGMVKPLTEFYKHSQMADGHVNKCKDCNKKDIKGNYQSNMLVPGYINSERSRGRKKYHRLYADKKPKSNPDSIRKWLEKFPEKIAAKKYTTSRLVPKGFESHHWSYNIEHVRDVIALTKRHHMKAHRFLVYDQERMMYRRYDTNELLDSKEKHEQFILWCIDSKED